jgi:DNA-binding GntR family transcriptional regulator
VSKTAELPPKLLRKQAYEELKRRILQGQFAPGAFLSERQLSREFGMSKTPIRAALERLEGEGFVRVSPNQGIVVSEPSIHELVDVMEVRQVIEGHVVRGLAGRLTASQEQQIRSQLEAQRLSVEQQDVGRNIELDVEFHMLLSEFTGNRELHRILLQLHDKTLRAVMQVTSQNNQRLPENFVEHSRIAEAIFAGDGDEAVARLCSHLAFGRNFLVSRGRF